MSTGCRGSPETDNFQKTIIHPFRKEAALFPVSQQPTSEQEAKELCLCQVPCGPWRPSGPWPLSQRIPISSLDVSGPGNMALESLGGPCTKPLNLELSLWHQLPALCISIKGIDRYPCSGHHVIAAYRLCGQGVCAPPYPPPSMSQAWWEVQEKPPVSLHQGKHPSSTVVFPGARISACSLYTAAHLFQAI